MGTNSAPASELETLILRINDLEHQLQAIFGQGIRAQNALTVFRVENAFHLLRLGEEVWPIGYQFGEV